MLGGGEGGGGGGVLCGGVEWVQDETGTGESGQNGDS